MIIDYHMHLELDSYYDACRYTVERIRLYVEQAARRDTDEIGITEHCNRFSAFRPVMEHLGDEPLLAAHPISSTWLKRSFNEDLAAYVETLRRAQSDGLPVKASIEVDYMPGHEEEIREILEPLPFDYILGSVHFLDGWALDMDPELGWPEKDVDQAFTEYFETLEAAARSGLFDVLAHPDLIKKFGHSPTFPLDELYDSLAKTAKEADVAVEISSAGLHKRVGELYPAQQLLDRFHAREVPITLGSDAHRPEHVGRDLDQNVRAAREAGYGTVATFTDRRRTEKKLG